MFSKEYADYVIKTRIDKEYQEVALKIISLVQENGILKMTIEQIASKLSKPTSEIDTVVEIMKSQKNPLIKKEDDAYVFDYPEKDVQYVEHLRRALSNIAMLSDDFWE